MLQTTEINLIHNAVVSIYIHLARIQHLTENEIGIIHNMLKSIFGKEIEQQNILKYIENLHSIRQATNILKRYLQFTDKIKLLLNLLSITYFNKQYFRVLGSLEIIKIIDLLYIDINIYDRILDLFENKTDHLNLSVKEFLNRKENAVFSNIMIWGEDEESDVLFRDKTGSRIIFLIFEKMFFVGFLNCSHLILDEENIKENKFYIIKENQNLHIKNYSNNKISVSYKDIFKVYDSIISQKQRTIHYKDKNIDFDLLQNGGEILLSVNSGNLKVNGEIIQQKTNLAVNDIIEIQDNKTGLDILCNKIEFPTQESKVGKYYLEIFEKFFRINLQRTSKTIIMIQKENNDFYLFPLKRKIDVFVNNQLLIAKRKFEINKDIFTINEQNFKINKYLDIIKIDYDINELQVNNLFYVFKDSQKALDGINFYVKKSEIMVILGPSGSGKTTLLKTLIKDIIPDDARLTIDGYNLYSNFIFFRKHIGYVPQDDLLFSNLTVYENLYFCARLRLSHIKDKNEIDKRITNILKQTDLYEKRNTKVGDVMHKSLSGGQRKRLNIALELLSDPLIIILDEPTSGLSSKDSEKLVNMLIDLKEQGKIIIATIHQPNSDLFRKFDKILFLDKNGTQVYFGKVKDIFDYFDDELKKISIDKQNLIEKKELKMPEYLFDILEYPAETYSGELDLSQNMEHKKESRKFPPSYWKDKYNRTKLVEIISSKEIDDETKKQIKSAEIELTKAKQSFFENLYQFYYLFVRNLKNKFTNKINLIITFIAAPLLAFLVSIILRYQESGSKYTFYENENIFIFIFISIIIFIFLGLANSLDEILSEKRIILREKKLNIKSGYFLISKDISLSIFTIIQAVLFFLIASIILNIRGIYAVYIIFLFLSGMIGFSIGLLASAFIQDRKAVINILPLVLIPQIMFAGAVIKFDKMNSFLNINKKASVPEFCELIPSKWLFEGLIISQAKLNKYDSGLNRFNKLRTRNGQDRKEFNQKLNEFLQKNYDSIYRNSNIKMIVDNQDGEYLLNSRNFFLTSKKIIFKNEIDTILLNIIIILTMVIILNLITYFKLTYFY